MSLLHDNNTTTGMAANMAASSHLVRHKLKHLREAADLTDASASHEVQNIRTHIHNSQQTSPQAVLELTSVLAADVAAALEREAAKPSRLPFRDIALLPDCIAALAAAFCEAPDAAPVTTTAIVRRLVATANHPWPAHLVPSLVPNLRECVNLAIAAEEQQQQHFPPPPPSSGDSHNQQQQNLTVDALWLRQAAKATTTLLEASIHLGPTAFCSSTSPLFEVPAVVYHMLLNTASAGKPQQAADVWDVDISAVSRCRLLALPAEAAPWRSVEGTVLMHVNLAARQSPRGAHAWLQRIAAMPLRKSGRVGAFALACVLAMARMQHLSQKAMDLVATLFVKARMLEAKNSRREMLGNAAASAAAAAASSSEEDVPNESGEFASEAVSAGGSPTTPRSLLCRLLVVVAQSAQGQWECVQPSLVEVGFRLLASRDHSASDACNGGGANGR